MQGWKTLIWDLEGVKIITVEANLEHLGSLSEKVRCYVNFASKSERVDTYKGKSVDNFFS